MLTFIQKSWRVVLGFAILMGAFCGAEIYQRATLEADGLVVSSQIDCMQPQNNRCDTVYVVEGLNHSRTTIVGGSSDAALHMQLPVGASLVKRGWSIDYFVNGQRVGDFPMISYGGRLILAVVLALWALLSARRGT